MILTEIARALRPGGESMVQMPNRRGIRSLYHLARRRFGEGKAFDVRYYSVSELVMLFERIIGPSVLRVDGFFRLGISTDSTCRSCRRRGSSSFTRRSCWIPSFTSRHSDRDNRDRNPVSTFEADVAGALDTAQRAGAATGAPIVMASSPTERLTATRRNLPVHRETPLEVVTRRRRRRATTSSRRRTRRPTDHRSSSRAAENFSAAAIFDWSRIVPGTIRAILRGERPTIRSDGTLIRDYFYVEDGAAAYMLLAERLASNAKPSWKAFNFSNETQLSVSELVERILS